MRTFDGHVKQSITVRFVQRHVSGHGDFAHNKSEAEIIQLLTPLVCQLKEIF